MFNKLKKTAKKQTKKTTSKVKGVRTDKDRSDFIDQIEAVVKKNFDTKGEIEATIIMAANKNKNIAVGAGDKALAFAILFEYIKHLDPTDKGILATLLLGELEPAKKLAAISSDMILANFAEKAVKDKKVN